MQCLSKRDIKCPSETKLNLYFTSKYIINKSIVIACNGTMVECYNIVRRIEDSIVAKSVVFDELQKAQYMYEKPFVVVTQ